MASFRFDFFAEAKNENDTRPQNPHTSTASSCGNVATNSSPPPAASKTESQNVPVLGQFRYAPELAVTQFNAQNRNSLPRLHVPIGQDAALGFVIAHSSSLAASQEQQDKLGIARIAAQRDVLTGVYEGGFKVWECAIDLVSYLHKAALEAGGDSLPMIRSTRLKDLGVLEAGCGFGLPGVWAASQGAKVCFQDLNLEVLESATAPTAALNCISREQLDLWFDGTSPLLTFFHGDWIELAGHPSLPAPFSWILTTDTLYALSQVQKLAALIHETLERKQRALIVGDLVAPAAYVAAKRYYFGTDGGTFTFRSEIMKLPPVVVASGQKLCLEVLEMCSFEDGMSNIRDILRVCWVPVTKTD